MARCNRHATTTAAPASTQANASTHGLHGWIEMDPSAGADLLSSLHAGIGITPFIARMKPLAMDRDADARRQHAQAIDLDYSTADFNAEAIAKLGADAEAAGVRLHVLHDARDGLLSGDQIRAAVPEWREAGVWFCGPAGFGAALREDIARQGLPVAEPFHQELFSMR